ncbi:hypothetical protein MMC07_009212 [Pseudocyphellaria aurata]|nr:hypothetical protein [Pseudocyphellaria aurata]
MPSLSPATGLTITNPLVLYRTLVATKQIKPDLAQHRLALHLQKLYLRLKDYSPEVKYSHRLDQLSRVVGNPLTSPAPVEASDEDAKRGSIFSSFSSRQQDRDVLALTKRLTDHESAVNLQSPQGLLLYGEVGTGKSMLVDLLADCLPNPKKSRWHFNTFMLETFGKLEQLRRKRYDVLSSVAGQHEEHSLLCLARDMISTSPILFLDEFQLPDRAAAKILSILFTSFFQLGGVLIATSNRMPEELANASGVEFAAPPSSRLGWLGNRWGLLGAASMVRKSENMFPPNGDFAAFLGVLCARCEVWNMEGGKDWRRQETELEDDAELESLEKGAGLDGLGPVTPGNLGLGYEQSRHTEPREETEIKGAKDKPILPKHYFVLPQDVAESVDNRWDKVLLRSVPSALHQSTAGAEIAWESTSLRIYGRNLIVPCHLAGVTKWDFHQLCNTNLGPADYISLASTFHTFILTDVPILTLLQKNEARRFITLLDALYEARCKLLIRAEAGPDDIFFPETEQPQPHGKNPAMPPQTDDPSSPGVILGEDETYAETFSEIYQDRTSPFRPNVSSYTASASAPSYPSTSPSTRSVLADEDSDFGPVSSRGPSDGPPGAGNEIGPQVDFSRSATLTGEDEKFAYRRARSRLWEMCGARWWAREAEGWWRPLPRAIRRWEQQVADDDAPDRTRRPGLASATSSPSPTSTTSPYRVITDPPPQISWTHAWGMMRWGRKAGVWGQGVEGLAEREKEKESEKKPGKGEEEEGEGVEGGRGKGII